MGRAWCQVKNGGMALIAVPTAKDTICFNGHRLYGPFLYQHSFANWKLMHSEIDEWFRKSYTEFDVKCRSPRTYGYQPIHILKKTVKRQYPRPEKCCKFSWWKINSFI